MAALACARHSGRQLLLSPCPVEQRAPCAANAANFAQVRLQLTLLTHVGFEAAVEFGGGTAQRYNRAQLARQYGVVMAQG